MLKYALLAGSMMFAAPAFAQDLQTAPQHAPTSQTTPPTTDPAAPAMAQDAAPVTTEAAPAPDSTASQPATGTQVADVVSTEFAGYDKDANGTLNATEFNAWMLALKSASDPATKPESKATRTWLNQAFAQADKDKSKSVSKTELTGFLQG